MRIEDQSNIFENIFLCYTREDTVHFQFFYFQLSVFLMPRPGKMLERRAKLDQSIDDEFIQFGINFLYCMLHPDFMEPKKVLKRHVTAQDFKRYIEGMQRLKYSFRSRCI